MGQGLLPQQHLLGDNLAQDRVAQCQGSPVPSPRDSQRLRAMGSTSTTDSGKEEAGFPRPASITHGTFPIYTLSPFLSPLHSGIKADTAS